jgi:hypothetical protein
LNIFLILIFKKIFFFFDLNKVIFLFSQKIYDLLTFYPPRLYKSCLQSKLFIFYHPNIVTMLWVANNRVYPVMLDGLIEARNEMERCSHKQAAGAAICEAIPNKNNVWHMIFAEHRGSYSDKHAFWSRKYNEARYWIANIDNSIWEASS